MPLNFELTPMETPLISTKLRDRRWGFWRAAGRPLVQRMLMQLLPPVTNLIQAYPRAAARDVFRGEFDMGKRKSSAALVLLNAED